MDFHPNYGFPIDMRIVGMVNIPGEGDFVSLSDSHINELLHSYGNGVVRVVLDLIELKEVEAIYDITTAIKVHNGELTMFNNLLAVCYNFNKTSYGVLSFQLEDLKGIKDASDMAQKILSRVLVLDDKAATEISHRVAVCDFVHRKVHLYDMLEGG